MLETGIDVSACQYGQNEQVKIKVLFSGPYGCKITILGHQYHVRRTFEPEELSKTLGRNRTHTRTVQADPWGAIADAHSSQNEPKSGNCPVFM